MGSTINHTGIKHPSLATRATIAAATADAHQSAVTGHFAHPHGRPWKHIDAPLTPRLATLIGAKEEEVAHTSTLTSNIHSLFTSFYRPTKERWKIVIEKGSFPSDWVGLISPRASLSIITSVI